MNAHVNPAAWVGLASAKRGRSERKGVHAWHPYYAGYSESFVDTALDYLGVGTGDLILDPWAGSGTTGMVAARRGVSSLCLDINPVMATFCAAKASETLSARAEIEDWLSELTPRAIVTDNGSDDPIDAIFDRQTARRLRAAVDGISSVETRAGPAALTKSNGIIDPSHAFCQAVVFVALRRLSGTQRLQNPTWLRTANDKVEVTAEELVIALKADGRRLLDDLSEFYGNAPARGELFACVGDARAMPLRDSSVDGVITSPPYLTRIDYAISTLPEMMIFGDNDYLEAVRHRTMGAPVITRIDRIQRPEWGPLCNGVLDAVRTHETKAAATYYWKNIIQYFMDMEAALREVKRVLKPGRRALVVVQSSYFKDVEIPLGDIYVQAAQGLGMTAGIAAREAVKTHMAHVNTRSSRYKSNKVYFEDVVEVRRAA